jgi:hypothetical protein
VAEPVILFGAFDRHNLGDLLLARIAQRLVAPRPARFAGLAERDLTPWGGLRVEAIARVAADWGARRADLVHVGGELLTCTAYQAAVMLQTPDAARTAITRYDADPQAARDWAAHELGLTSAIPYLLDPDLFRQPGIWVCNALGGVDLGRQPETVRAEIAQRLRRMAHVSVRDATTQAALHDSGLAVTCSPDPAVLTAACFGADIAEHAARGETARVRARHACGYIAVQFSAGHGDDATLRTLAAQLARLAADTGLGLVLFRAGAAPWHDDLEVYRRLRALLPQIDTTLFESLHLWDICALLANAAAYCGESLHGRIVAEAFGVPAVSLVDNDAFEPPGKTVAYARTWAAPGMARLACFGELDGVVSVALREPRAEAMRSAQALQALFLTSSESWRARLGLAPYSAAHSVT